MDIRPVKLIALDPEKVKRDPGQDYHDDRTRLADFIRDFTEQIVTEWATFARTLKPASTDMTPLALRDHIHEILTFISSDLESMQTGVEQTRKSHGEKEKSSIPTAAETHAALRLAGGFNIDQMVSEYRALRASVIRLWRKMNTAMDDTDLTDLIRFNESIDQELAESVILVDNTRMFVDISDRLGMHGILHSGYEPRCTKLASFGCKSKKQVNSIAQVY